MKIGTLKTANWSNVTKMLWGVAGAVFLVVVWIQYRNAYEHRFRDKTTRVKAEQRSLQTALDAYRADFHAYPMCVSGAQGANGFLPASSDAYSISTFRVRASGSDLFHSLTTPVNYIERFFADPYAPENSKGAVYGYYSTGTQWVLFSPGPDGRYDIDPVKDFIPGTDWLSPEHLLKHYDPTNGIKSPGDIFRVNE